jgi:hypothetical protein
MKFNLHFSPQSACENISNSQRFSCIASSDYPTLTPFCHLNYGNRQSHNFHKYIRCGAKKRVEEENWQNNLNENAY